MPWKSSDAQGKTDKADTPAKQKKWAETANAARDEALKKGASEKDADAQAIKIANAAIAGMKESDDEPATTSESLREYANCSGQSLRVDRAENMVHGVKIIGLKSKNEGGTREYTPEALAKAVPLYEGAAVFVDHCPKGQSRSYKDRNGALVNVRTQEDGLYADHKYNPAHPVTEQYLFDAEHAPKNVGFSHDADGAVVRKDGKAIVTEILAVRSVDLVARPASVTSLFEETEITDPILREIAENCYSAMSDIRSEISGTRKTLLEKCDAIRAVLSHWRWSMQDAGRTLVVEGEIADKIAQQQRAQALRKINGTADDLICNAIYDDETYPDVEAKKQRVLSVLTDWEAELKKLPAVSGNTPTTSKESKDMEWTEVTAESLKENRKDLFETLTGTSAMDKANAQIKGLTEQVTLKDDELKTLKEQLSKLTAEKEAQALELAIQEELKAAGLNASNKQHVSTVFLTTLKAQADKASRTKLIEDRKSLVAFLPEAQDTPPMGVVETTSGTAVSGPGRTVNETKAMLRG